MAGLLYAMRPCCPENRLAEIRSRAFEFGMGPWSETRFLPASHHLSHNPRRFRKDARSFVLRVRSGPPGSWLTNMAQHGPISATPRPNSKTNFNRPFGGPAGLHRNVGSHDRTSSGPKKR